MNRPKGPEFDLNNYSISEYGGAVLNGRAKLAHIPELVGQTLEVSRKLIHRNPDQPRKVFKKSRLKELQESIEEAGQADEIQVVPIEMSNGDIEFLIIDGERRDRSLEANGETTGKVLVKWIPTLTEIILYGLMTEGTREKLTDLERARAYKILLDEGLTKVEIGKKTGQSSKTVGRILKLLTLTKGTQKLIETGKLSVAKAKSLAEAKKKAESHQLPFDEKAEVKKLLQPTPPSEETETSTAKVMRFIELLRMAITRATVTLGTLPTTDEENIHEIIAQLLGEEGTQTLLERTEEARDAFNTILAIIREEKPEDDQKSEGEDLPPTSFQETLERLGYSPKEIDLILKVKEAGNGYKAKGSETTTASSLGIRGALRKNRDGLYEIGYTLAEVLK